MCQWYYFSQTFFLMPLALLGILLDKHLPNIIRRTTVFRCGEKHMKIYHCNCLVSFGFNSSCASNL